MNRFALAALIFATAGAPRHGIAAPQTCVWTGHGGNALWSTDGNWTCIAVSPHAHPQNGDDVGFPDTGLQPSNTNDLSQLVIHHLTLDRQDLLVTGNPISLSGGVGGNPSGVNGSNHGPHFELAIKLAASTQTIENTGGAIMEINGPLDLNGNVLTVAGSAALIVNGAIGGFGSITKTGNVFVYFEGNNTYTGNTVIEGGALVIGGSAGLGAAGNGSGTFVQNGGALFVSAVGQSIAEPLSLDGNGYSELGALTVAGDGNVITSGMAVPGVGAAISVPLADTTLTIAAPISGGGKLKKVGDGTLRLDSSAPSVDVSAGVLELNGADGGTVVFSGATLAGIGTAFGTTGLSNGSFASPGARSGKGIGTLAVQDLAWSAGAQMRFQLGRSAALSDQMTVSSNLTHSGSGTYNFAFSDASTPPVPGVTYTLITFASNQGFAQSDFTFSYAGIPAPGQPTGMIGAFTLTSTQLQFTPSAVVSDLLFRDGFD